MMRGIPPGSFSRLPVFPCANWLVDGPTGGRANGPTVFVDVRDMLCAQALAVVAKARAVLPVGGRLEIRYNAEDVRHDMAAWAAERGDHLQESGEGRVLFTRRDG